MAYPPLSSFLASFSRALLAGPSGQERLKTTFNPSTAYPAALLPGLREDKWETGTEMELKWTDLPKGVRHCLREKILKKCFKAPENSKQLLTSQKILYTYSNIPKNPIHLFQHPKNPYNPSITQNIPRQGGQAELVRDAAAFLRSRCPYSRPSSRLRPPAALPGAHRDANYSSKPLSKGAERASRRRARSRDAFAARGQRPCGQKALIIITRDVLRTPALGQIPQEHRARVKGIRGPAKEDEEEFIGSSKTLGPEEAAPGPPGGRVRRCVASRDYEGRAGQKPVYPGLHLSKAGSTGDGPAVRSVGPGHAYQQAWDGGPRFGLAAGTNHQKNSTREQQRDTHHTDR
ncbi:hypothetical protein KM043_001131 [Ampulex compressa]|nr:hypothetical protein KM043_001131 [Ampulex compressa]